MSRMVTACHTRCQVVTVPHAYLLGAGAGLDELAATADELS